MNWPDVTRVSVIMPTWIGDVVMATPAIAHLRTLLPEDACITAMTRPKHTALLEGIDSINSVTTIDPRGVLGPWRAGRTIARNTPDAVLVLPGSFRSALAARLSGCSRRIGWERDKRGWLLTEAPTPPSRTMATSTINLYRDLVDPSASTAASKPELVVTQSDRQAAADVIGEHPTPFVVLVPAANKSDKRWPSDRFAAVANSLHELRGWTTVIAGVPSDRDITSEIASQCTAPVIDLAAVGSSLGALKSIMQQAEVAICIDTGPRHVAIGVGTPTVSLFGPTDHRWTIVPDAHEVRLLAAPFLTENLVADSMAKSKRLKLQVGMKRITPADVLASVCSLDRRYPSGVDS